MKNSIGFVEMNISDNCVARQEADTEMCSKCGVYIHATFDQDLKLRIKLAMEDVNFPFPWALCEQKQKGNLDFTIEPLFRSWQY